MTVTRKSGGIHFPLIYGDTSIYDAIRTNFAKILDRDDLIKQYFRVEHIDQDNIVLKTAKE
jgi:hypothetical protein